MCPGFKCTPVSAARSSVADCCPAQQAFQLAVSQQNPIAGMAPPHRHADPSVSCPLRTAARAGVRRALRARHASTRARARVGRQIQCPGTNCSGGPRNHFIAAPDAGRPGSSGQSRREANSAKTLCPLVGFIARGIPARSPPASASANICFASESGASGCRCGGCR